jgi:hypothetical protein
MNNFELLETEILHDVNVVTIYDGRFQTNPMIFIVTKDNIKREKFNIERICDALGARALVYPNYLDIDTLSQLFINAYVDNIRFKDYTFDMVNSRVLNNLYRFQASYYQMLYIPKGNKLYDIPTSQLDELIGKDHKTLTGTDFKYILLKGHFDFDSFTNRCASENFETHDITLQQEDCLLPLYGKF